MQTTKSPDVVLIKAINRWARKRKPFLGGMEYGVDWPTWAALHPQIASTYRAAATRIVGRDGLFMPHF